jgi:hypothetical protein
LLLLNGVSGKVLNGKNDWAAGAGDVFDDDGDGETALPLLLLLLPLLLLAEANGNELADRIA